MVATIAIPGTMKMPELKEKAKYLGVNPSKLKKTELIMAIQQAEGFTVCFGTTNGTCENLDCCFMKDCLKIKN